MRVVLALALALSPQDSPKVDQARVDQAIKRGVEFLRTAPSPGCFLDKPHAVPDADELILFTLLHAGVPPTDPRFQELLTRVLDAPLQRTYKVSLQAMVLEGLDPAKHQLRLFQCAQFLVDNQCKSGQWSYGEPVTMPKDVPSIGTGGDVATTGGLKEFGPAADAAKSKPAKKIPVKKQRDGPDKGDNSNSQYAALGLRACHDGGIEIPEGVLSRAVAWWRMSQNPDKAAQNPYGGQGWCYRGRGEEPSYASMTAGAVGALILYSYMQKKGWKRDPSVLAGLNWLTAHFSVTANPGKSGEEHWYSYYLYALERAGVLFGTEKLGRHEWYAEGAAVLLRDQKPNGSWEGRKKYTNSEVWDTCFAILFLRRATRPLVATEAGGKRD
jgi:hypothetical protein